jgi:uncharacterized phage protein (TIGR02218 family)
MKKNFPSTLLSFLQSHVEFQKADLFTVLLGNGQAITATDWQLDVLNAGSPPTDYFATKFGMWKRGTVISEASFDCTSNTMSLTVAIPNETTVNFPGTNTPLFQTVSSGLFDKAQVWVYTAYAPLTNNGTQINNNGFDTTLGLETTFMGEITNIDSLDRSQCTFEVADLLYRLNLSTPQNIVQSPCRFTLFDANCLLNSAPFHVAGQVASGSTQLTINTTAALPSVGTDALPYTLGVVKFTSGQNAGLAFKIKIQNSTTQFVLDAAPILPIAIGDQFTVLPGCDLSQATCKNKFNNLINFGGFPFTPQPEVTL